MRRRLSESEARLWERVAETVTPLAGRRPPRSTGPVAPQSPDLPPVLPPEPVRSAFPPPSPSPGKPTPRGGEDRKARPLAHHTLDATWDRKMARGAVLPDFTLDLHGATLDAAHARLDHGLTQALAQGARVVLLITGRPRPHEDHASRGERRGAIRAKFLDWLSAGPHASRIAAIRPAHPRHGGAGAVYIVLRRPR